ncbi:MAG: protein kinase [Proteobacteria bacterium]|nr:protein kinase [Pseudomonadota bacterium]
MVIADRFRLFRLAGTGGMGSVYEARDIETELTVAVKVISRPDGGERTRRFAREARALSELRHPGIVHYLDYGVTASGERYMVMEWLRGHDLKSRLERGPLSERDVIVLGLHVASALSAAHSCGLVHRDIKPGNLFLVDGDVHRTKLIDFGLVQMVSSTSTLTPSGVLVGTPSYMAPEQALAERRIDGRTDLYSLGAVLFECLTGRTPFRGDCLMAVLAELHFEDAPRVRLWRPSVSDALDELIARLLAKQPDHRPGAADEVVSVLDELSRSPECGDREPLLGRPGAVTSNEKRFFTVALVDCSRSRNPSASWATVTALAREHDVELERITADTAVAMAASEEDPVVAARRAAGFALSLGRQRNQVAIALATGSGEEGDRLSVGEVVDRAVEVLLHGRAIDGERATEDLKRPHRPRHDSITQHIAVDKLTATLIEQRFQIDCDEREQRVLVRESPEPQSIRIVLGKPTPYVGRDREISAIEAVFRECVDESLARAILVTGPAGIGKSRLVGEIVQRFASLSSELSILAATGDLLRAGSPLFMLSQLVRAAVGIVPGDGSDAGRDKILRRVEQRIAPWLGRQDAERVAVFLGEITGLQFSDTERMQLREARRSPHLIHDQMRRAWEDWLEAESLEHPVFIVLDDLQWADPPSIRFINALLRNLEDKPIMVLALARPEVDEILPDLWTARNLERIALYPLSRQACENIARHALPDQVADTVIDKLVARSGGNPFYLEELVRSLAAGFDGEISETILAIVGARLRALLPSERRVLRAASVFGRHFWLAGVAALLGDDRQVVTLMLNQLIGREVVRQRRRSRFADETEYVFTHDLLREAAYGTLPANELVPAHLYAAEWLERAGETDSLVLAEHYQAGADSRRALPHFHRAAEQALAANDFAAVIDYAERAISCGARGETLGALRLLQAESQNWTAQYDRAAKSGHEAMELLASGSPAWAHACHQVAWSSVYAADWDPLQNVAHQLRDRAPESIDGLYLAAMVHCACNLLFAGYDTLATALHDLVEERTPSDPRDAFVRANLAWLHHFFCADCDPYKSAQWIKRCVDHWNERGDRRSACMAEANMGESLMRLGQYEQAIQPLSSALETARRLGLGWLTPSIRHTLALTLARAGKLSDAEHILAQSQDSDLHDATLSHLCLAQILLLKNCPQAAMDQVERALDQNSAVQFPQQRALGLALRAVALLRLGRAAEALQAGQQGMEILSSSTAAGEDEMLVRLAHADALHACGQQKPARQALRGARALLLGRAESIKNPEWRTSFLEQVDENRRILELARQWNVEDPRPQSSGQRSASAKN